MTLTSRVHISIIKSQKYFIGTCEYMSGHKNKNIFKTQTKLSVVLERFNIYDFERPNLLHLGTSLFLKKPVIMTCIRNQTAPIYQKVPSDWSLTDTLEFLPSYFVTVNQKLV